MPIAVQRELRNRQKATAYRKYGVWCGPRRILHAIESWFLQCKSRRTNVASQEIVLGDMRYWSLGPTRQNHQILAWCLQQQTSQGKWELCDAYAMLAIFVGSIDYTHLQLRKNAVSSCTRCREQTIRAGICHLPNHQRSSRRRRKTNPPPTI